MTSIECLVFNPVIDINGNVGGILSEVYWEYTGVELIFDCVLKGLRQINGVWDEDTVYKAKGCLIDVFVANQI